jgi:hypothetical protein
MNKKEKTKLAASILGAHEEMNEVYVCDDGNAFRTEAEAKAHVKPRGITFECFEKANTTPLGDLVSESDTAEAAEKEAAENKGSNKGGKSTKK